MLSRPMLKHPVFVALVVLLSVTACDNRKMTPLRDEDMSLGPANAKVTLVEYASVTCSHCAEFNADIFPQIKAKYIDSGKIRYVYREVLTPPNNVSAAGVLLARCAGKDNYFKVIDAIMRSQDAMFSDDSGSNAMPTLLTIAKSVGMTEPQFNKCITDPEGQTRVNTNDENYTKVDGVTGTPTFFIDGKLFKRHTGDFGEFDHKLSTELAKAK